MCGTRECSWAHACALQACVCACACACVRVRLPPISLSSATTATGSVAERMPPSSTHDSHGHA
eukprot:5705313-Pleurochrysis_carterae.AAC.1